MKKYELLMKNATLKFTEAENLENDSPRAASKKYWEGVTECYEALEDCTDLAASSRIKSYIDTYTKRAKVLENVERNGYKEGGGPKDEDDIKKRFQLTEPATNFDDVVGMYGLKEKLDDAIVLPLTYPELFKEYVGETASGILLYGPPGCGKTYIAKSIAGEASKRTGKKVSFVNARIDDILSSWVGSSEKNMKAAFQTAAENEPCVLFLDEIDAIARTRGSGADHSDRLVNQFLTCFELIEGKKVLVLGATNNPWAVDAAALREGRFGDTIYVEPPDYEARKELFKHYLKKKPHASGINLAELAEKTDGFSPSDIKKACKDAGKRALKRKLKKENGEIVYADLLEIVSSTKPSIEDWKRKIKHRMEDGSLSMDGYEEMAKLLG